MNSAGILTFGFPTTVNLTNLSASGNITAATSNFTTSVTTNSLNLSNPSNTNFTTTINSNNAQSSSYSLTLPIALPTTNQPLFVNSSGLLTTGFPTTVNFTNITATTGNFTTSATAANLILPNTNNTAITTTIKSSISQSSSYSLTLPTSLPTSTQALLSDTNGILTWGTVSSGGSGGSGGASGASTTTSFTSFSAQAPQSTTANVTGLQFTQIGSLQVFVNVNATTPLAAVYIFSVYQLNNSWQLSYSYEANDDTDTGIDFQINASSGQVTYTSPSFSGWTTTTFTWPTLTNTTASGSLSVTYPALKLVGVNSAANVSVAANANIMLPAVLYDTVSMYSMSTGVSTIKVAGIYLIQAQLYLNTATTGVLRAFVNGVVAGYLWQNNTTSDPQWKGTCLLQLNQGDTVTLSPSASISIYVGDQPTSQWSLTMVAPVASSGNLLAQNPVNTKPSPTQGTFLSIGGPTVTDTGTAASGTATGFTGTYIAAPTLAATNTGVTTTSASTFTIAGAPIAGTNETLANAYSLNVQSGRAYFGGDVGLNGTTSSKSPLVITNHPFGTFVTNTGSATFTQASFQFTYVSGNIGTTLNQTVGIPITVTGLYMITHGFEASNVTEYVMYLGTDPNSNANRILNRFNNGAAFPDSRHSYSQVVNITAPTTLNAYLSTNASTSVTTTYSKGMVISLIARTA